MNRRAVALAADSASTITRWVKGEPKRRYFKGTNKIFHLSLEEPVGMMINGSGNLQGVPWDLLVKTYRDNSRGIGFDRLGDYPAHFFSWVEANREAFTQEFLDAQFLSEVIESAGKLLFPAIRVMADKKISKARRPAEIRKVFDEGRASVEAANLLGNLTPADLAEAIAKWTQISEDKISAAPYLQPIASVVGITRAAETAITAVLKSNHTTLDDTGVVVCGYGRKEYFPSVCSFSCFGNVLGKLIVKEERQDCRAISQENTSEIVPFAKSEMIYTFVAGTSISGLVMVGNKNSQSIDEFEESLRKAGHLDQSADIESEKLKAKQDFKDRVTNYFRDEHMTKLRGVVGVLPINELAELSETLVQIESIKERVTTDEESVSGPIDVAVISKNDGFIWIKRKHYFERELNPRFFSRAQMDRRDG